MVKLLLILSYLHAYDIKHFQPQSIAVINHQDAPFTQGLSVRANRGICPAIGSDLDACMVRFSNPVKCFVNVLQGCEVAIYESSGLYGKSLLRKVSDLNSGKPTYNLYLPDRVFGEGSDVWYNSDAGDRRIIVGSWLEGRVFEAQEQRNSTGKWINEYIFPWLPEIWGVAVDDSGQRLWITGGKDFAYQFALPITSGPASKGATAFLKNVPLRQWDSKPTKKLTFTCDGQTVNAINEIDYDWTTNSIWANVWFKNVIIQFDAETGSCLSKIDIHEHPQLRRFWQAKGLHERVWNGVAFLDHHWLIFTGKNYPYIFLGRFN